MNLYEKYSHMFEHFQSGGRGGKDWKELNCSESNDEDQLIIHFIDPHFRIA